MLQLRALRGGRGHRRPRLRYDRWPGGRARAGRTTSRPACPAASLTCSAPTPVRVNTNLADLEDLDEAMRPGLQATGGTAFTAETGSAVAARLLADWDAEVYQFEEVMPRGLQAGAARGALLDLQGHRQPGRRSRAALLRGADPVADPKEFLRRETATRRRWTSGSATGARCTPTSAGRAGGAGRAVHGLRDTVLPGLPAGQADPDWFDLVWRHDWRDAAPEQHAATTPGLPGGSAAPASARACSASTPTRW